MKKLLTICFVLLLGAVGMADDMLFIGLEPNEMPPYDTNMLNPYNWLSMDDWETQRVPVYPDKAFFSYGVWGKMPADGVLDVNELIVEGPSQHGRYGFENYGIIKCRKIILLDRTGIYNDSCGIIIHGDIEVDGDALIENKGIMKGKCEI